MNPIKQRQITTPHGAYFAAAKPVSENGVEVTYYGINETRLYHVNVSARLMTNEAYEKMVGAPKAPTGEMEKDVHDRKKVQKDSDTAKRPGRELTDAEKEALADSEDAEMAGSIGDDDHYEVEVKVGQAKEPKPKQGAHQNLGEAMTVPEPDELFDADTIAKALAAAIGDDDLALKTFYAELQKEGPVQVSESVDTTATFNRLYRS